MPLMPLTTEDPAAAAPVAPPIEEAPPLQVEPQAAAPVEAAPVESAPVEEAPQSNVLSVPPGGGEVAPQQGNVLSVPPAAIAPAETAEPSLAPPIAPQDGPPNTGSAADAIGATAQDVKTAAKDLPANLKDGAKPALTELTGVGRDDKAKSTYQPAPDGVEGVGGEQERVSRIDEARARSDQEAQQLLGLDDGSPDLGNIGNVLGSIKDVGMAHAERNKGEVSPERANNLRWTTERLADEIATGDPFSSDPDAPEFDKQKYGAYFGQTEFAKWARENPELFMQAKEEGYTTPDGQVWAPGLEAPWELFQAERSGLERGLADFELSPLSVIGDVATGLVTMGGSKLATEATEQATRLGARAAANTALKKGAGEGLVLGARAADAVQTFGLSEGIPLGFKLGGKALSSVPWLGKQSADAQNLAAADQLAQSAEGHLRQVNDATGTPGVPTIAAPSQIQPVPTKPDAYRVVVPPDATNPAIDITYHVKKVKDGKATREELVGVYDTAVPGPADRYRSVTEVDAQSIYDAWGRLAGPDRTKLRQAAYPELTRLETAPGEPFIESAAERIVDPATGRVIADTGRIGSGYDREKADLRRSILADGRPDQIVTDFTGSWVKTWTDGKVHPLTRHSLAEHRLQTLVDTLDTLPASYRTPEIMNHVAEMRRLLPKKASAVGTGTKWTGPMNARGGRLVNMTAREKATLLEIADLPSKTFNQKGTFDAVMTGGGSGNNSVFNRKPPATAPQAFHNGYTAYMDIMRHRLNNAPTARADINAMRDEINALRRSPGTVAQARQDAIGEVLETHGIIPPGTSAMGADAMVIAIESYQRVNRPTFPRLPGMAPGPPAGTFPAGSQQELWGIDIDPRTLEQLELQIDVGGVNKTAGQRLKEHWTDTRTAWEAAQRQSRGIGLTPKDTKTLKQVVTRISQRFPEYKDLDGATLGAMRPEEVDRISAALLKSDLQIAQKVRSSTGKMLTPSEKRGLVGKVGEVYDGFISMWRSVVLYNVARGAQYIGLQAAGNAISSVIAVGGRNLPYYLNLLDVRRGYNFLRNPEVEAVPRAIQMRDDLGLGRTKNLGRVSKDQIGARTFFNKPDSHAVTKAVGTVFGNQRIKDWADSWDLRLRHSLYEMVMGPAFKRLRKDLVPMVEGAFQDMAAARGVPIGISRAQIDTALRSLDGATKSGMFSKEQLRTAIFEAAGGTSAPYRDELMGASRNVANAYDKEIRKLDDLANAEVERVAFAGGDTNLEGILQRLGVFTWWIARATRLFATEAAKSPVQMALWARALEAGQQNEREGVSPRQRQMLDFLETPAGYVASLNPYSLLGTYLLGTTADPTDPRNVLTRLGEITQGGFIGDNVVLNPLISASLDIIGAKGQDARMTDLFGTGRLEREIFDALNYVNHHWLTFHRTKEGNPDYIAPVNFGPSVVNLLAQQFSGKIPGTQKVADYPVSAPHDAQISALIEEQVLRDNPELDPNDPLDAETLRTGVDAAMADHDSAHWQEAEGRYVDSLYLGPGSGSGGIGNIVGAISSHFVLPTNISRQPTYRADVIEQRNRDAMRKAGATHLDPEGEINELEQTTGVSGSRSDDGRELALIEDAAAGDPLTRSTKRMSDGLMYDTGVELKTRLDEAGWAGTISVDGYTFTAEQIASLPFEDRRTIANRWVDSAGLRPVMTEYSANRLAQLKSDKAYADAEGWDDYVKQYEGGPEYAIDHTAQINPNYRAFLEGYIVRAGEKIYLPDLRKSNPEEWMAEVTRSDEAKTAIAGIQDSKYGLKADPYYAGLVSGSDVPVGAWYISEQEARATGADNEFVTGLREDHENFTNVLPNLDKLDAAWGRPVGTTRAQFVQGVLGGALDSATDKNFALPYEEHKALEAMGISDHIEATYRLKSYLEWELQQPAGADTSLDAYNQAYWSKKNAEEIPNIALRLATGQVPPPLAEGEEPAPPTTTQDLVMQDGVVTPGVRPGPATLARPTILATEPGGTTGVKVPAGMPIETGQRMAGSTGSVWVFVSAGPGVGGWVNVAELGAAA
jgi:hypothetical protein